MTDAVRTPLALPVFEAPVKVLIVIAPYYTSIAELQLTGAKSTLEGVGAIYEVIKVPGALEIPTAIGIARRHANHDGYVALGCVIRGETTHYGTVCAESNRGLTLLGMAGACIGNGILTVEDNGQALARADPAGMDKGGGAAAAALHLIAVTRHFGTPKGGIGFKPRGAAGPVAGNSKESAPI
ncbi:MAG: 6,7-dimethyl-8-ribityllumazine synthase [Rhodobacteraceae bacterium]|nr:6,7-dimethyl-8-ribityllumazine synthase [Paracoccaceae bacterium]